MLQFWSVIKKLERLSSCQRPGRKFEAEVGKKKSKLFSSSGLTTRTSFCFEEYISSIKNINNDNKKKGTKAHRTVSLVELNHRGFMVWQMENIITTPVLKTSGDYACRSLDQDLFASFNLNRSFSSHLKGILENTHTLAFNNHIREIQWTDFGKLNLWLMLDWPLLTLWSLFSVSLMIFLR